MNCTSTRIPYRQTGGFSKLVLDYIDQVDIVKPFIAYPPSLQGIQKAIEERKRFTTNRTGLVQELKKQYEDVDTSDKVKKNIESLLSDNTFTITSAHQNNIFTGPLYFIYKIIHSIKLADSLKASLPEFDFVPVFYIGSEDADLDELNNINLGGKKLVWETKQTGAVGRMKVDKALIKLIGEMEGQLSVLPHGAEIINLIRDAYKDGVTIEQATFIFINTLFKDFGLIVLKPDNAALKKELINVFEDDLLNQRASGVVESSIDSLSKAGYKVQANPREINLFYLKDDLRERIIKQGTRYKVQGASLDFSADELIKELKQNPERFSPNVILRGLYQETILPDIVFIGGGGETAYWLQLKSLFDYYKVPFPVLILRNSFLIVEEKWKGLIAKLNFTIEDFFLSEQELLNRIVEKESSNETKLNGSLSAVEDLYESFKKQAAAIDSSLEQHVEALKTKTVFRLHELEKKMLRAEKRKYADKQRQIQKVRAHLFPGNGLQERYENISYYYAKYGKEILQLLYNESLTLEHEFVLLSEK